MMTFLIGLTLGVAGGVHCTAMCGPLMAAVSPRGWRAVVHHAGRSTSYVILGVAAGVVGAGAAAAELGRWMAWLAAAWVLALAVRPHALRSVHPRLTRKIVDLLSRARNLSRTHPFAGAFAIGALNGLLPCGLAYAAAIAAAGTGTVMSGALLMSGFAAGTTAILAVTSAVWITLAGRLRQRHSRYASVGYVAVALLLAWRGWMASLPVHVH